MNPHVVVLAGGSGGAKLARGMLDVVAPEHLTVVANTGDDLEIYGAHVSPDPDLVSFWLADRIDERGWGLRDDTFHVMAGLRELGEDIWFNLGDRDLAVGIQRAATLRRGGRLTDAHARVVSALGVQARVLPMSDQPVRTRIQAAGRWWPFQEFMIKAPREAPVTGVDFRGARTASATAEVRRALAGADAIVVGPSNPVVSIGPILAVSGMREALREAPAPVVAVSPIVRGQVLKGPTAAFMEWAGRELTSDGVADMYPAMLDGLVADRPASRLPTLETDVELGTPAARRAVAEHTLRFALGLRR